MKTSYPAGKSDLMTAFMIRARDFTVQRGTWAMINLPSWMSLKSFEALRRELLQTERIVSMVHLGRGIFGSDFGTVAFVIDNAPVNHVRGVYRRLFEQHVDVRSVSTIEALFLDPSYNRFDVHQADIAVIPGSPIAYWLSEKVIHSFRTGAPLSETVRFAKGLVTADNGRFVREMHEVALSDICVACPTRGAAVASKSRWFPYSKGGEFRRWFGNIGSVVNWEQDGSVIRSALTGDRERVRATNFNLDRIFQPGVCWTVVTSGTQSFRLLPSGFLFDAASGIGQSNTNEAVLALLNSTVTELVLSALNPTLNLHPGYLGAIPLPFPKAFPESIGARSEALTKTSTADWDSFEISIGFTCNPLVVAATKSA